MRFVIYTFLLFFAFSPAGLYASSVIGEYSYPTGTFPIVDGVKESFHGDSVIRLKGAVISVKKGTVLTVHKAGDGTIIDIEKGHALFKVAPEKSLYSFMTFMTPQAEMRTPAIVRTSGSLTQGSINASDPCKTVLQLDTGTLKLIYAKREIDVEGGQVMTIADDDCNDQPPGAVPVVAAAVAGGVTTGIILATTDDDEPASPIIP